MELEKFLIEQGAGTQEMINKKSSIIRLVLTVIKPTTLVNYLYRLNQLKMRYGSPGDNMTAKEYQSRTHRSIRTQHKHHQTAQ